MYNNMQSIYAEINILFAIALNVPAVSEEYPVLNFQFDRILCFLYALEYPGFALISSK